MKRLLLSTLSIAALSFAAPVYAADAAADRVAAPAEAPAAVASISGTYNLDASHTHVSWTVEHMGYSHFNGKFANATGTVTLDEAHPENSKLNVTVNTSDIVTGVPKLDEHLKGDQFFNIAKFPTATFVSDKVEPTGKDTAKVTGTLTLLGVSKPVTLDVKLNKAGEHPMMKKNWVGFDASTTLKRSDWGLSYGIPMVSDEVKLEIEAEAGAAS